MKYLSFGKRTNREMIILLLSVFLFPTLSKSQAVKKLFSKANIPKLNNIAQKKKGEKQLKLIVVFLIIILTNIRFVL